MNRYEAIDRIVALIYREHDEATKEALMIALKDMRERGVSYGVSCSC